MSAANDDSYSAQRFRGGFALVWWERGADGERARRRRQLAAQDRQSAEAEARALWQGSDDSPWTVGRIMTAYLATMDGKRSEARRADAWKAMRGYWEKVMPAGVNDQSARAYRATRKVGDATARYELMMLSTALNWAVKTGKIAARTPFWLPPVPERKERHLTRAEFAKFLDGMRAHHARLYALIGIYTMARPGAILELTWDRVDFMRRRINFTPEGHVRTAKRRTIVPIGDKLLRALQEAYEGRTSAFVIEHGGKQVHSMKKAFQRASERSAVHATPYTLRHTGAVWAAEEGIPMPELAQMMGHDDDRTTQAHYARYSPDYLARVVRAVEGSI
jgi:integrase